MTIASERIEIDVDPAAQSGVAWGAIVGGALAAAAVSLILMVLGAGFGLSVVSPWSGMGVGAATVAVGSLIWLIVVQWIASGFGGYLTGRMRSRSAEPSDEVFFRDTANGFLSWALGTVLVVALLTSAISSIVGTGAQVAATVTSGAAQGATQAGVQSLSDPTAYFVDSLYRAAPSAGTAQAAAPADTTATAPAPSVTAGSTAPANTADTRAESGRILVNGLAAKEFPPADLDYLAQQVSTETGLSPDAAKARVNDVVQKMQAAKAEAQAAADAARKGGAKLALFMFLSLLIGAFIAAAAAALGGVHRDEIPAIVRR